MPLTILNPRIRDSRRASYPRYTRGALQGRSPTPDLSQCGREGVRPAGEGA